MGFILEKMLLSFIIIIFMPSPSETYSLWSLSSHNNENIKKAIGLLTKTTTQCMHHTVWYISLLKLSNNAKFY